jgi:hypothetical protein
VIVALVILLPIIVLASVAVGVSIGWRAAKDQTPIEIPSIPAILPGRRRSPETPAAKVKPQETP